MGAALRMLSGFTTAASTTFTALTMGTGDSLTIQAVNGNSKVWLLNAWGDWQTAGNLRIRSTKLHDAVQGIRLLGVASEVMPLMADGCPQLLYSQDTLTVEMTGSGTGGDIESVSLLLYYEDLPGAQQRMATYDQIKSRIVNIFTSENSLATGTGGGYTGEEAINAELDQWKANTDYALLGYNVSVECCSVGWRSTELSNLRVGGPGNEQHKDMTRNWFKQLSQTYNLPLIPIFNAANKASILVDAVQDENGADTIVTSYFAELRM